MKNLLRTKELYLTVAFFLAVIGLVLATPRFSSVKYLHKGLTEEKVLPISEDLPIDESFAVELQIKQSFFDNYRIKINPDDCVDSLFLNGKPVRVDTIPGHCDWGKGFTVSSRGLRSVKLVMRNKGGPGGIFATVSAVGIGWFFLFGMMLLALIADLYFILHRLHIRGIILFILFAGILFRLGYAYITGVRDRTYDIDGHIEYITYISEFGMIPDNEECWSCYHPPLYYSMAAPFWDLAGFFNISKTGLVQWVSVFFSVLTLGCGLLCLRYCVNGGAFAIAGFLWAFWPGVVLASPRIGNDILFALAHVLCLWSCLRYLTQKNGRDLIYAAMFCWGAFYAKTTGTVTIALWFVTFVLGYFPRNRWKLTKAEFVALGLFLLLMVTVAWQQTRSVPLIGNLDALNSALKVGNEPRNYLFFDIRDYLTNSYTNGWDDAGGRQYFWNYLAKSSLFGEFRLLSTPLGNVLAMILSVCLLGFAGFAAVGVWTMRITKVNLLFVVQAVLFVVALAVLRFKAPYACSNDFRYIVPALLSFAPFVGMGIASENASLRRRIVGGLMVVIFVGSSIVMLMSL